MNKKVVVVSVTAVCLLVVILFALWWINTPSFFDRSYHEDIVYQLHDGEGSLVIKEWTWLLGGGSEIYYQQDPYPPILLGEMNGGDDGFSPFKAGLYTITEKGDSVTIDVDRYSPPETFHLPRQEINDPFYGPLLGYRITQWAIGAVLFCAVVGGAIWLVVSIRKHRKKTLTPTE